MRLQLAILVVAFLLSVNSNPRHNRQYLRWKNEAGPRQWMGGSVLDDDYDSPAGRIVGGKETKSGQAAYQLYMRGRTSKGERYHCGAALINEYNVQFALTAAHCVYDGFPHHSDTVIPKNVRLTAGEISLKMQSGREQVRTPHRIVMHESFEYDEDHPHDDIAIIFFSKPFTINFYVQPIALPDYRWADPNTMTISGWGSTAPRPNLNDPDLLQIATVPVLENYLCGRFYKIDPNQLKPQVDWKQICLRESRYHVGFCEGDSGGPGTAWNSSAAKYYLAGIGSYYLRDCGDLDWPAVYTKVSAYTDWIRSQVSEYIRLYLAVSG